MVTAAARPKHTHTFQMANVGKDINRGTCKCGEIREYTGYGRDATFTVIQTGNPDYEDRKPQIVVDHTDEIIKELTSKPEPAGNIPLKPNKGGCFPRDRHAEIEAHADEIIKDLKELGTSATQAKWGISNGGMYSFCKRHGIPTNRTKPSTEKTEPSKSATVEDLGRDLAKYGLKIMYNPAPLINNSLPLYPAFNNDWEMEVQLRWMDGYLELKKMEATKHDH